MINSIRRDAMEQHASPAQGNRPTDATPSLDDLLSPTGPYRLRVDEPLAEDAQMINGEWWQPEYGCDSVAHLLDLIRSRILPHLRPPVKGIDVPGPDGDWLDVSDLCIAEGVDVAAGARLLRRYQEALPAHALPLPTTTTTTETTDD